MADVWGTPRIIALFSGTGPPTVVHPIFFNSHPQNLAHRDIRSNSLDVDVFKFFFGFQVSPDEVLSVDRVVAHVELHDVRDRFLFGKLHEVKPHVLTYEIHEFIGRYFSKALEPGDLDGGLQSLDRFFLFLYGIAVPSLLLVGYPEQGSLEDVDMPAADQVWIVLHEESQYKHPDVHSVVIGISRYDNVVVAEVVEIVFYSESRDKEVEFLILRHPLPAFLIAVDWLSPEAENSLVVGVAYLGDRARSGISLSDEYACLFGQVLLVLRKLVSEMVAAVTKLAVVDIRLLVPFTGLFLDAGYLFALGLGLFDLILYDRNDIKMDPQVVVQVPGYEIVDE